MKRAEQGTTSQAQQPERDLDPALRDTDLMRLVGLRSSQFYKRKARGDFRFLELRPQLPNAGTRYSRALVQQWLDGELVEGMAAIRFFTKAQGQAVARRRPGRPRRPVHEATA